MSKKIIIAGCLVSVIIITVIVYFYSRSKHVEHVHLHAGFKVFKNGKLQDFSDIRYMSLIPCGDTDPANEQLAKAHLHDKGGDVVHVHRKGAIWEDLFQNINYQLAEKNIESYINGEKVDSILSQEIKPYDSVIILMGSYDKGKNYLAEAVVKQHIQEVEKSSELCGS